MSFLYPLFLAAAATLAIPILIHLFNLRRYKTVLFPHTRFLKTIQLKSQKRSQLKYKWLLALRLLFLASLILAFAQPFFRNDDKKSGSSRLQVIYLDNSGSMSVKKGARNLFEAAREAARRQVQQATVGSRFVLITNDKPVSYQPLPVDKVLSELNSLDIAANSKPADKVLASVQSIMQSESVKEADVYYYSDFQRSAFPAKEDKTLTKNIRFYGIPVQPETAANVYIDTAYIDAPVVQSGMQNKLVVRSRIDGAQPKEAPVLQLNINGQVKSAATINFDARNESIDTLSFQVSGSEWQRILLTVNDAVRFDDTFRIAARSSPNLSVLVLNESQASPYIQAAFNSYNGFQVLQNNVSAAGSGWDAYNLVILNGISRMDKALGNTVSAALQNGLSICIFPARTQNYAAINEGLQQIADIHITGIDTATQTVSNLQQGSDLVRDMFESIPENVQLPVSNWHYIINAGLTANQQSVLSFRNGDPFLARYTPSKGQLYICAATADMQSGNFAGSYFFVPFLYQMAMQSRGGDIYAVSIGGQQAAFVPFNNTGERNMLHVRGNGIDMIPPQRPAGKGLDVFLGQAIQQPGFYTLGSVADTVVVGVNSNRTESQLATWDVNSLKKQWNSDNINWVDMRDIDGGGNISTFSSFPLWKVCVILALIMLAAETFLLAGGLRKQSAAANASAHQTSQDLR